VSLHGHWDWDIRVENQGSALADVTVSTRQKIRKPHNNNNRARHIINKQRMTHMVRRQTIPPLMSVQTGDEGLDQPSEFMYLGVVGAGMVVVILALLSILRFKRRRARCRSTNTPYLDDAGHIVIDQDQVYQGDDEQEHEIDVVKRPSSKKAVNVEKAEAAEPIKYTPPALSYDVFTLSSINAPSVPAQAL